MNEEIEKAEEIQRNWEHFCSQCGSDGGCCGMCMYEDGMDAPAFFG